MAPPETAGFSVEVAGPVVTVTLDRPQRRNAQLPSMWRGLAALGEWLPEPTRVVVLTARGPSFSAGLDLALLAPPGVPGETDLVEMGALPDHELDALIDSFQQAFTWWRRPGVVSVASVAGHAVGAGFQLALATDLRIVAADARFAVREPALGLVPDLGGTARLVEAIGYARAVELCLTGRWMDAAEAVACGLAVTVVPVAALAAATADLVAALLAAPEPASRATLELLRAAAGRARDSLGSPEGLRAQLAAERAAQRCRLRDLTQAR